MQLKALLKSAVRVTLVVGAAGIHIIHAGVTVETVPMRRVAACTVEQSPAKVRPCRYSYTLFVPSHS